MKALLLLTLFSVSIAPSTAIFSLISDIFSIPAKIIDAFLNPNIELDSRFTNQNINEYDIIHINFGFGSGVNWRFGTWSNVFSFEKYGPEFDLWLRNSGKTPVSKGDIVKLLQLQLGVRQRQSFNWFINWMTTFLNMDLPDNFKIKMKFGQIPREVQNAFHYGGGSRLDWFLDLFKYLERNVPDKGVNKKFKIIFDIVIGKLKILTGQHKRIDAIILTTTTGKIHIPIQELGDRLTDYFMVRFRTWEPQTTQWLINIFFRFLFPTEEIDISIEIPKTIENIFPNSKDKSPFQFVLYLIDDVLIKGSEVVTSDIIVLLKYLKGKVQLKLPKIIVKWVIYNGLYIPVGKDGNVLTDITPIKVRETNIYIIKWVTINGILVPLGPDDKLIPIEKLPNIIRWIIVNNKYIPIGEDNQPIDIKPLTPNENHLFVLKWIVQNGKYIPENPDGSISDIKIVVKWILSNGLYIPLGENGKLVPGLKPLRPGEKNIIITWKPTSNGLIPIGPDDQELSVEEIISKPPPKQKVIRWIVINERFFPIGTDGKPIVGVSPLTPGEQHYLVDQWITVDGTKTPISNDGSVIPIYTVVQFEIQNNKFIAINPYGESIPGLGPLTPGERNLFINWKITSDGMILIGPDGKPIPVKTTSTENTIKIGKWIIINKKYVAVDVNGNLIKGIDSVLPGEPNIYILKWITINGQLVPVDLNGAPMVVEQSTDETKLPSGFKIIWKFIDGKYVPTDMKGNVFYIVVSKESTTELQDLMWKRYGEKYVSIYMWLTPILESLLKIRPEFETLPIDYLIKAPVQITELYPLPASKKETEVLKWFEKVLFTLTDPLPGADLQIGLLKYIQIFADKLEHLVVQSQKAKSFLVYEGLEIPLDENGKPILYGPDGEPLFDFSKVPKEILEGNFIMDNPR